VDAVLDMELGRAAQRILRALLLRRDGITRRGALEALYADKSDM